MNKIDDFKRLTFINSLLSLLSAGPSQEAVHIHAVLRFLRSERGKELLPSDYDDNVTRIVELHDPARKRCSIITHWDLRQDCIDPLWLRANLLGKLKLLGQRSRGLLVISGLKERLCPPPMRWTRGRAKKYHDLVNFIEQTAAEKTSSEKTLTLLFV
ncbi:MAG: hypothetical protein VB980_06055 [Opitutales bacterium]